MKHYKTISQLHQSSGYPAPENPMLSLLTCNELNKCSIGENKFTSDFYIVALKKIKSGNFYTVKQNMTTTMVLCRL